MYIAAMSKVFLFVEIEVQPGKVEAFLQELKQHIEVIRGENGCEAIDIFTNESDENLVHVWEVWGDRTSWDTHMVNPSSQAWQKNAAQFVVGEKISILSHA